jgi:hypothetical protein
MFMSDDIANPVYLSVDNLGMLAIIFGEGDDCEKAAELFSPKERNRELAKGDLRVCKKIGEAWRAVLGIPAISVLQFCIYSSIFDICNISPRKLGDTGFYIQKYDVIRNMQRNAFYKADIMDNFMRIFCITQRIYRAFSRLAFLFKYRRAKIYNTHNLGIVPISITDKNTIVVFQNKKKYLFTTHELCNIVNTSLSNCAHFFPCPVKCKNPYTNTVLDDSALYYIYFKLVHNRVEPEWFLLFTRFFVCEFSIDRFLEYNECLIQEYNIKRYAYNSNAVEIYDYILDMFEDYNYMFKNRAIEIHEDFPKNRLGELMRPYLHCYIQSKYSVSNSVRIKQTCLLKTKMKAFYLFNSAFGRLMKKFDTKTKRLYDAFNDKCIGFYGNVEI